MATLAAFISSAIEKVSHNEVYANMEFATPEEARTNFTSALLFELGLGPRPVGELRQETPTKKRSKMSLEEAANLPLSEGEKNSLTAAPKKRAPKKTQEAVVPVVEAPKEAPKEVEALAEQMKALTVEEPKPKKARKTKAAEPVGDAIAWDAKGTPVAYAEVANAGAAPEKKKPGPKPKAKPEGAGNLEKLTPTHKKHIKAIAAELKVEAKEKEFLVYANEMTAEAWGAKPLDDHIREFLTPETPELAPPPTEFHQVNFNGKDYLVDPASRFVYAMTDSDKVKARDQVGIVGMGAFEDMEIPEEDE
jgi:hypothetical protein